MTFALYAQSSAIADAGEHDDAVREDEPVAEVRELAREEAVAREQGGEPREALVRRVRGEHEHREREHLHDPVHEPERRRRREDARAICDRTDGVPDSVGSACMCTASHDTPRNIAIATTPSTSIVFAAFLPCGRRNALTPFAIASTPVSAVEPDENARSTTKSVTAPDAGGERVRHHRVRAPGRSRTSRSRCRSCIKIAVMKP